ncbi:MAG TPA: hypothetical protein VMB51_04155 [Solirubrobacteraceae bacterium]|nr:hypothetical protein [Solirubrobacteraceae bacterium]
MSKARGGPGRERGTVEAQRLELARARAARLDALWKMSPSERVLAMRRGQLTLEQCAAWAARYPEQVPLLNGLCRQGHYADMRRGGARRRASRGGC